MSGGGRPCAGDGIIEDRRIAPLSPLSVSASRLCRPATTAGPQTLTYDPIAVALDRWIGMIDAAQES